MKLFQLISVVGLFVGALHASAVAAAQLPLEAMEPLPTPPELQSDVRFWETIFTKYSPDDCLFHDKENVSIQYFVKRMPEGTVFRRASLAKRYQAVISQAIAGLADGHAPRNAIEERIVKVTPPSQRTPAYYRAAAKQVRCQRGVDLQPSLSRSKEHLGMVMRVLGQKQLPTDLAFLPHLESGYNPYARSRVGAKGLWQLMPSAARLAGLSVGRLNDHRTHPHRSTAAAAMMLSDFYQQTGSWPLAITAYNYGINGTMRAIKMYGNDYMAVRERHRTSLFGFAARNYYPSFLAVRNVASAMVKGQVVTASSSNPAAKRERAL
ncbi:MAG: lytic transglycosylase domain-containing protein [Deltaproteobacteria bacterium]|nr:lytic transglycosylase domain-containing protein [Deltaproteobacteria bacterium]